MEADAQLQVFFKSSSIEHKKTASQTTSYWADPVAVQSPSVPHFGIWEAAVKSLKHHLRWVVGDSKLIFEEMSTLLAQVEACLNSRSLQTLSDDPENLATLTPGHFLVGSALTAISEPSLLNQSNKPALATSPKDAKSLLEPLVSRVFTLSRLSPEMDQGVGIQFVRRLCLIRSETTPPTKWPLAQIT